MSSVIVSGYDRSITLIGTAVAVLTASSLLTVPASADRVCKKSAVKVLVEPRASTGVTVCTCAIETTIIGAQASNSVDRELASILGGSA